MPAASARAERLGLLGGTFDPPHLGHVAAAQAARRALSLDRVLLVVANDPWQKSPLRPITGAADRLAMTEAAVEGEAGIEASRMELDRGGPSYTVDTVEQLRTEAVARGAAPPELFVIVGADIVPTLPTWHRVDELRALVTLVIVARPHAPAPAGPPGWHSAVVGGLDFDVSSSQIRERLAGGEGAGQMVPPGVGHCIAARGLYAVAR
ncbi:MAG TPA: nicotinate (nicotinamide) nucleotide adenylyltransferase [Acidimicrobiales bacterium]|nr:nicotinate (nicotinamide) nucleotide adenylyltransferase [Acidimicrobiales bacterium]